MQAGGIGNAVVGGGSAVLIGWGSLPLSILLAIGLAVLSLRLRPAASAALRAVLVALLLPGLVLALQPGWFSPPGTGPVRLLVLRALGTLPLLVLPSLSALGRMVPGQNRAAVGLGAGPAARLRLLWLPQLGPACLLGLCLAGIVDALALLHGHRALFPSLPPS